MFEHLHFLYNEATNMSKTKDKAEILAVIRDALLNYEELIGQTFLYVFDNRCIEVLFKGYLSKGEEGAQVKNVQAFLNWGCWSKTKS
jgi:hypothetical protein